MAFRFVPLPGSNPRTSPLPAARGEGTEDAAASLFSPQAAGESHLANKRLFCCGKSILGVLR
ncbi:hypothetical protein CN067_33295 [Sinorhizobium meliloti]|nr:hypothetical protein CN067_33295 [Sinorhizobium meliloti]